MVDLGFLLITFFMLATSWSKPYVLDIAQPVDGSPTPPFGLIGDEHTLVRTKQGVLLLWICRIGHTRYRLFAKGLAQIVA